MNVEHLREFAALARTRSFTGTARELSLAQSTLSKHIAALEGELGFRLFDRSGHDVVVTEAGKAMLENVLPVLEQLDKGILRARLLSRSDTLPVRVGGYLQIASIARWIYRAETVARDAGADVRVSLYAPHTADYMPEAAREDSLDLLRRGEVDLAVIEGPAAFPELDGFGHARLFDEPIVFFAPTSSPLAQLPRVELADLRGRRFIGSLNYAQFQDRVREICAMRGFVPEFSIKMADSFNEFMRSDDPGAVFFLSASGAARVPDPPYSPLAKLPVSDPEAYSPVYAVWVPGAAGLPARAEVGALLRALESLAQAPAGAGDGEPREDAARFPRA